MSREAIVEALREAFSGRTDVVAAYLFGSVARGDDREGSDVDVGVVLTAGAPRALDAYERVLDIQDALEQRLARPVDVVPMDDAPVDLLHRILRDGIVVHESDHRRRVFFELKARNEYFDMQPILEYYRRTVLGSI